MRRRYLGALCGAALLLAAGGSPPPYSGSGGGSSGVSWPSATHTANYTLALSDASTLVAMSAAGNTTITIPTNASVAFPAGTTIRLRDTGGIPANTNRVTVTPASGVKVDTLGSLTMVSIRDDWMLTKIGTDEWSLTGNEPTHLVNADYALTTTDAGATANAAHGVMQFWGVNGDGNSGVSCGPGNGTTGPQTLGTGTLSSRVVTFATGGPTNGPYRQLNVVANDNWDTFGMRCELGSLEWRFGEAYDNQYVYFSSGYTSVQGTFALFKEGQHRITDFDIKLESNFTLSSNLGFQQVAQWKQAPPSTNVQNSGSPVLEVDARNNQWQLVSTQGATAGSAIYTTPATLSTWYHIRLDCYFSQFTAQGWCQLIVTPWTNGGTSSGALGTPVYSTLLTGIQTLAIETGTGDMIPVGSSIVSALMIGPYVRTGSPTEAIDMTNIEVWEVP